MLGWLHSKPAEEVLPAPLRPAVMMGGHAGRGSSWWYSPSHTRPAFNSPGSHSAPWWAWWYRQEGWKVNKTVYWVCYILRFRKMGRPLVQTQKICMECRRSGFHPWVRKIPWRREWPPTPGFLSGKSHGQRSLVGYSPWDSKGSDITDSLTHTLTT